MVNKTLQKWMTNEVERLSSKLKHLMPGCSGYNRIQSMGVSKSVRYTVNAPYQIDMRSGGVSGARISSNKKSTHRRQPNVHILDCPLSNWDMLYPSTSPKMYAVVRVKRAGNYRNDRGQKVVYNRNMGSSRLI
ncbi:uncharacterized protein LOC131802075 [Musca domestica]|uniref:Uncharacterized protein LOC131802075 n=1 Tax=Musca domestica TaxID=7370 RepID=A0ABM3UV62_MUSDO|nr:uncharacterized protein LOC131802075 [Musca domestica]